MSILKWKNEKTLAAESLSHTEFHTWYKEGYFWEAVLEMDLHPSPHQLHFSVKY